MTSEHSKLKDFKPDASESFTGNLNLKFQAPKHKQYPNYNTQ
jgi:hypothetical protein